jgi:hypothetical protein
MPPLCVVVLCLEGKGAYGFFTGCKGQALRVLQKIFLFPSYFGRAYFLQKP